jgi:hydrogenase maturation factor
VDGDDAGGVQRALRGSPIKLVKRRGLPRNVAVTLGNWVRGHAARALRRIGTEAARQALRGREEV